MAGTTTLISILVLLVLCAHCLAPAGSVVIPSTCCMTFISKRIHESRVVSYQFSSKSVCPKAGVIFTTKKGKKFCGNPEDHWVQMYMKNLDAKRRKTSARTAPMGATVTSPRCPCNSPSI